MQYEANTLIPLFHIYRARWGYIMGCSDGLSVKAPRAGMDQRALGYQNTPEVDCFWQEVSCCGLFLAGFSSFSGIDWAILPCNFVFDGLRVSGSSAGIDQYTPINRESAVSDQKSPLAADFKGKADQIGRNWAGLPCNLVSEGPRLSALPMRYDQWTQINGKLAVSDWKWAYLHQTWA